MKGERTMFKKVFNSFRVIVAKGTVNGNVYTFRRKKKMSNCPDEERNLRRKFKFSNPHPIP